MNQFSKSIPQNGYGNTASETHINRFDISGAVNDVEEKISDLAKANESLGKHFSRLLSLSFKG